MSQYLLFEMQKKLQRISTELNIKAWQCENAIQLRNEGGTVPFIARYRKERTGELDENILRVLFDKFDFLTELDERKSTILKTIEEQGKLTDDLKKKIEECYSKNDLEDIYLPYKPKKKTRASTAKEKGLEPLAELIKQYNTPESPSIDLSGLATAYINSEKAVHSIDEALGGAADIIAEEIAETAQHRSFVRDFIFNKGEFVSSIKKGFEPGSTKYEMYRAFKAPIRSITAHNMLALRRGEKEEVVELDVVFDEDTVLNYLFKSEITTQYIDLINYYQQLIRDGFNRLMRNSIIGEIRLEKKNDSDIESISVFESNLRQILLSPPAGMKTTIGIDPGFRTGCKIAVIDQTGKFIEYKTIFPHGSEFQKSEANFILKSLVEKHQALLIAIGNGTAGRETEGFVRSISFDKVEPVIVMVNESGASIYSAGKIANEEFPELDLTIRGAISIARRLQDPLAELVKIDPKSIGVGQYQHDVDQKLLKKKLDDTVSSCVNFVGVDVNTASKELLTYVSGISSSIAGHIVNYRNKAGSFKNRSELMNVDKYGPKTFELSAGFLRIKNGDSELDNTAVHPESYHIAKKIIDDIGLSPSQIAKNSENLSKIDIKKYITETVGEPTLRDIISELEKPGLDPRSEFKYAEFDEKIKDISDLKEGIVIEGVVTNITHFGAFVDIGVHQDGLVHISEISDTFIKDATKILKVGQIVKVKVISVDTKLNRIQLSIKKAKALSTAPKATQSYSINDLKSKFGQN